LFKADASRRTDRPLPGIWRFEAEVLQESGFAFANYSVDYKVGGGGDARAVHKHACVLLDGDGAAADKAGVAARADGKPVFGLVEDGNFEEGVGGVADRVHVFFPEFEDIVGGSTLDCVPGEGGKVLANASELDVLRCFRDGEVGAAFRGLGAASNADAEIDSSKVDRSLPTD